MIGNLKAIESNNYDQKKQILSMIILIICILLFIFSNIKTGIIVMSGGMLCIILGFIDEKKAFLLLLQWKFLMLD